MCCATVPPWAIPKGDKLQVTPYSPMTRPRRLLRNKLLNGAEASHQVQGVGYSNHEQYQHRQFVLTLPSGDSEKDLAKAEHRRTYDDQVSLG